MYNIICDSLNLEPRANNGTLRLPFKPVGLHDPEVAPVNVPAPAGTMTSSISLAIVPSESPFAPQDMSSSSSSAVSPSSTAEAEADAVISISPIEASSAADPDNKPPTMVGVDPAEESGSGIVGHHDKDESFWDWFNSRLDKLKGWFGEVGDKLKGSKTESGR